MIGITGAPGSGKSTVARMFQDLGFITFSADDLAHGVMRRGGSCFPPILREFGEGILNADGEIDRAKLASLVFEDARKRKTLENVVHPAVLRELEAQVARFRSSPGGAVGLAAEIPLLFEVGLERRFDAVVCCVADPEHLKNRLVSRGLSESEAEARMSAQLPQSEKSARSDYVIRTDCSLAETQARVREVWEGILGSGVPRQGEHPGEERSLVSNGS